MTDVQPFRGLSYNKEVTGNLTQVITPPYDVISEEAQAIYYARNPYNIIRLELGKDEPGDTSLNNRYTRAAVTFAEWRMKTILRMELTTCYYLYQQVFKYDAQTHTRTSLLARVRLEPWSAQVVLPHEHTMAKPKDDRLKLLRACVTNLSPIMSLYEDPQGRMRRLLSSYVDKAKVQITDEVNEIHRLHAITDEHQIARIQNFFAERQLYIADGHHRYETALNYREEVRAMHRKLDPNDATNFVLMALTDVDDPGLLVLPTHRLLFGLEQEALERLTSQQLARYFVVYESEGVEASRDVLLERLAQAGASQPSFVLSTAQKTWLLSLNETGKERMDESMHSRAWNELDVSIAHTLILEDILGLKPEDMTAGTHIRYTRDAHQALGAVQSGEAQASLIMNATRVRQICDVAIADDRMPQKSTYFYPKLVTGLVMNPLW
ncbi:MAG TPA: DUF1015 domain-containing protein [Ktedonobacteraceae bacterium]|nr:DUF1015 domain-containing protein [Ktedonobacteraceae bacterium]